MFVLLAALFALPAVIRAQEAPQVTDGGVVNSFPAGLEFSVSASSDSPVEELKLRYTVLPDGTAAIGQPEFTPGVAVDATFQLAANNPPAIYLPPGTQIDYYWEAIDANGNEARTETQTVFYIDTRFEWQSLSGEGVTINYYSGSEGDAAEMHDVAQELIAEMTALLQTTVPFEVQVWTYESSDDMRAALQSRSETYESQITTAGVRVASNTVLVLGNVSFDTLRHELTHVVTKQAGESALGTLPAWLDEGTAVYGQSDPGGFGSAVQKAIDRGNVLSVREISSYPGDPAKVELFYGQGWSLVSYLIDEYGEEKFAQLFAEVKFGKRIESALEATYGFGQDGLEDEWRAANGLPPRATEELADPDQPAPNGVPAGEDDSGASTVLVIGLAVGVIALAAVVGIGGLLMARRV
jgi:hypothetical protein